jgi:multicomponent Na+:H+ antiporter subunit E
LDGVGGGHAMIGYLDILLRLTIWFLLTADLSPANIMIGMAVALLLPRSYTSPASLKDWLRALGGNHCRHSPGVSGGI